MTQFNTFQELLSNSKLNTLKSGKKDKIDICNDEYDFSYKLLLTNKNVSRVYKAIANNSPADIKLSKV